MEINEANTIVCVDGDLRLAALQKFLASKKLFFPFYNKNYLQHSIHQLLCKNVANQWGNYFGDLTELCLGFEFINQQGQVLRYSLLWNDMPLSNLKNLWIGRGDKLGCFSKVWLKLMAVSDAYFIPDKTGNMNIKKQSVLTKMIEEVLCMTIPS